MQACLNKLKSVLWSKRALYILCFIGINFIELLRASQRGNVWYVAVNCMGIAMLAIVASAYPLKELCDRINLAYTILCAIAAVGIFFHWQAHIGQYYLWQVETALFNIWWIGIMARYLLHRVLVTKQTSFKPSVTGILWIAMSVFMICSVSQRVWPLWYLLMYGIFYLTEFTPSDRRDLLNGMIDGTIISFFGIQTYAYGFRPYDDPRYAGAFSNCNMMALYYLIVYLCVLFKLHLLEKEGGKKGWKLFYLTGAGGLLCFQLFTICRTAWLAVIAITAIYGIVIVKCNWKKKWHQVFLRGVALTMAVIVTFLPVYYTIRWLPTILHYRIWYEGEYDINKVHSFDPANSEKYVSLPEYLDAAAGRILKTMQITNFSLDSLETMEQEVKTEVSPEEKTYGDNGYERVPQWDIPWLDGTMQKRATIYRVYLRDTTWVGNGLDKGYYLIGDSQFMSRHAHNIFVQVFFTYGIPAGILMILLTIALFVRHIRLYRRHKEDPHACIPLFITILFFLFGSIEIVWNPGQLIMFLMFFAQHPGIYVEGKEEAMIEASAK